MDLIKKLLRPTCGMRARRHIAKIVDEDDYKRVYLHNINYPLYWPKDIPLYNLYMVMSESLHRDDWHYYEVPETRVEPGDVVLDCGAAEGLFSLRVMEYAQCIAIEPSPVFIESLKKTFRDKNNVQIIPYALSNHEGHAYLRSGTLDSALANTSQDSYHDGSVIVETVTIDQLVRNLGLEKVNYIKGDLESFELEVLQGGAQTIRDHKPKIAFTTYHQGNDWKEIRNFVLSLVPNYAWRVKGISYMDNAAKPVMIHFWPS